MRRERAVKGAMKGDVEGAVQGARAGVCHTLSHRGALLQVLNSALPDMFSIVLEVREKRLKNQVLVQAQYRVYYFFYNT